MPKVTAHSFEEKWRSNDVRIQEEADFSSLLLSEKVLKGLKNAGYKNPSPIQLEAIPIGRFGKDLVVQAKSGTGKTLVFTVIALEMLLDVKRPQVLILAPTREIAYQICDVIRIVGSEMKNLTCSTFIGGFPLQDDRENCQDCQIAVGTPGRIKQLITMNILQTNSIRLFVLDEADNLLDPFFKPEIDAIFLSLPKEKQVIAASATYPPKLKNLVTQYFREPYLARLNIDNLSLLGIVHYILKVPFSNMPVYAYKMKIEALEKILTTVTFTQSLVFCNQVSRVEPLCSDIKKWGFSATHISSAREQGARLKAIDCLKRFRCKVLVTSDLTARGIDAENVDLVINFDAPFTTAILLHRVGRAGRYGSKGAAVTLITQADVDNFKNIEVEGGFKAFNMPDPIPENLISLRPKATPDDETIGDQCRDTDETLSSDVTNSFVTKEVKSRLPSKKKVIPKSSETIQDSTTESVNNYENGARLLDFEFPKISQEKLPVPSMKNKTSTPVRKNQSVPVNGVCNPEISSINILNANVEAQETESSSNNSAVRDLELSTSNIDVPVINEIGSSVITGKSFELAQESLFEKDTSSIYLKEFVNFSANSNFSDKNGNCSDTSDKNSGAMRDLKEIPKPCDEMPKSISVKEILTPNSISVNETSSKCKNKFETSKSFELAIAEYISQYENKVKQDVSSNAYRFENYIKGGEIEGTEQSVKNMQIFARSSLSDYYYNVFNAFLRNEDNSKETKDTHDDLGNDLEKNCIGPISSNEVSSCPQETILNVPDKKEIQTNRCAKAVDRSEQYKNFLEFMQKRCPPETLEISSDVDTTSSVSQVKNPAGTYLSFDNLLNHVFSKDKMKQNATHLIVDCEKKVEERLKTKGKYSEETDNYHCKSKSNELEEKLSEITFVTVDEEVYSSIDSSSEESHSQSSDETESISVVKTEKGIFSHKPNHTSHAKISKNMDRMSVLLNEGLKTSSESSSEEAKSDQSNSENSAEEDASDQSDSESSSEEAKSGQSNSEDSVEKHASDKSDSESSSKEASSDLSDSSSESSHGLTKPIISKELNQYAAKYGECSKSQHNKTSTPIRKIASTSSVSSSEEESTRDSDTSSKDGSYSKGRSDKEPLTPRNSQIRNRCSSSYKRNMSCKSNSEYLRSSHIHPDYSITRKKNSKRSQQRQYNSHIRNNNQSYSNYYPCSFHEHNTHCWQPSQHQCHPYDVHCTSQYCNVWYNMFYQQYQFINRFSQFN